MQQQVANAFEMSPFARYCSNKTCSKLIIANPKQRRVICRECETETCFKCKEKYHKFPYCSSKRKMGLKMRLYYISHGTKQCPRCKFLIEKTAGCDHMTCSKCGHEFCWRCFKPYTPEHMENPFECSGVSGIDLDLWGPLAPIKGVYEIMKDAFIMITIGGFLLAFTWPYLLYKKAVSTGLTRFLRRHWNNFA